MRRCFWARKHIVILDTNVVRLRNPIDFQRDYDAAMWARLLGAVRAAEGELSDARRQRTRPSAGLSRGTQILRRLRGLRAVASLWNPIGRTRRLQALKLPEGSTQEETKIADGLGRHWGKVFSYRHEVKEGAARAYARKWT